MTKPDHAGYMDSPSEPGDSLQRQANNGYDNIDADPPGTEEWLSRFLPDPVQKEMPREPLPEGVRVISLVDDDYPPVQPSMYIEATPSRRPSRSVTRTKDVTVFNLHTLVKEVHDLVAPWAKNKELMFSWFIAPSLPVLLAGDGAGLRQTLAHLLQSSLQATDQGLVQLSVRKSPGENEPGGLLFIIRDSGGAERQSDGVLRAWDFAAAHSGVFNVEYSPSAGTQISFTIHFSLPSDAMVEEYYDRQYDSEYFAMSYGYDDVAGEEDDLIPVLQTIAPQQTPLRHDSPVLEPVGAAATADTDEPPVHPTADEVDSSAHAASAAASAASFEPESFPESGASADESVPSYTRGNEEQEPDAPAQEEASVSPITDAEDSWTEASPTPSVEPGSFPEPEVPAEEPTSLYTQDIEEQDSGTPLQEEASALPIADAEDSGITLSPLPSFEAEAACEPGAAAEESALFYAEPNEEQEQAASGPVHEEELAESQPPRERDIPEAGDDEEPVVLAERAPVVMEEEPVAEENGISEALAPVEPEEAGVSEKEPQIEGQDAPGVAGDEFTFSETAVEESGFSGVETEDIFLEIKKTPSLEEGFPQPTEEEEALSREFTPETPPEAATGLVHEDDSLLFEGDALSMGEEPAPAWQEQGSEDPWEAPPAEAEPASDVIDTEVETGTTGPDAGYAEGPVSLQDDASISDSSLEGEEAFSDKTSQSTVVETEFAQEAAGADEGPEQEPSASWEDTQPPYGEYAEPEPKPEPEADAQQYPDTHPDATSAEQFGESLSVSSDILELQAELEYYAEPVETGIPEVREEEDSYDTPSIPDAVVGEEPAAADSALTDVEQATSEPAPPVEDSSAATRQEEGGEQAESVAEAGASGDAKPRPSMPEKLKLVIRTRAATTSPKKEKPLVEVTVDEEKPASPVEEAPPQAESPEKDELKVLDSTAAESSPEPEVMEPSDNEMEKPSALVAPEAEEEDSQASEMQVAPIPPQAEAATDDMASLPHEDEPASEPEAPSSDSGESQTPSEDEVVDVPHPKLSVTLAEPVLPPVQPKPYGGRQGTAEPVRMESSPPQPAAMDGGPRIVIAETTTSNRRLLAHYLADFPHEHIEIRSNDDVIELLRTKTISLIVFDADMPDLDLAPTIKAIRRKEQEWNLPPTPILSLVSRSSQASRMALAGSSYSLNKPFSRALFMESVFIAAPQIVTLEKLSDMSPFLEGDPVPEREYEDVPALQETPREGRETTAPAINGYKKGFEPAPPLPSENILIKKSTPVESAVATNTAPVRYDRFHSREHASSGSWTNRQSPQDVNDSEEPAPLGNRRYFSGHAVPEGRLSTEKSSQIKEMHPGRSLPLPGLHEEFLDEAVLPLIPGLIHFLQSSHQEALRGFGTNRSIMVEEAAGRMASRAEAVGLHKIGRIARCLERAGQVGDRDAIVALLEDLEPVMKHYLESLRQLAASHGKRKPVSG